MPLNGRPVPLKAANLTLALQMYNTGTGLPWSNGTLANLTYYVSTEGGTEAASNGTPVQIATNSSLTYCNLTTSEMNGTLVTVRATADNAYAPAVVLYPSNAGADVAVQVAGMNNGVIANDTFASSTLGLTISAVSGAVGSVTGNVGGNVAGSVGSVTGNVGGNVVGSVASVTGNVGGNVTGNIGGNITGSVASVTSNVSVSNTTLGYLFTIASGVEANLTLAHALQDIWAFSSGKASGGNSTTITFRNYDDTKNRISATVDSNGNRTAMTHNYD